jgi:carboxyl-terminal processing protease
MCVLSLLPAAAMGQQAANLTGADKLDAADFARHILATTDVVLKRHIDPPPRQLMLADAVRALHQKADRPVPVGLGRLVSDLNSEESMLRFLTDSWNAARNGASVSDDELQTAAVEGLLRSLPESPGLIPPKEAKVQEQIRGNRYVGIGVQLAMDKEAKQQLPVIVNPFPRGPARVAGAKPGDRILEIDGVTTEGMTLAVVVDRLRGDQGTSLTLVVQAPEESAKRTLFMTRGVIPFQSFSGYRRVSEDEWEYRPVESEPIGYLQLSSIRASTLSELRRLAPLLESQGIRALVLDLRFANSASSSDVQHTVLLADEFLEEGPIGRFTDINGSTKEYQSGPDCLFRNWPIVLLVNQFTYGEPEFLAAALQDNHRAVVVGERTRGSTFMSTPVELPASLGSVMLRSGLLSRGDGRPLHRIKVVDADDEGPAVAPVIHVEPDAGTWGVRPDHVVAFSQQELQSWLTWRQQQELPEPPAKGASPRPPDPQLDKAVEVLRTLLESTKSE